MRTIPAQTTSLTTTEAVALGVLAEGERSGYDLLKRVDRDVIAKKPNVVVIQIGFWRSLDTTWCRTLYRVAAVRMTHSRDRLLQGEIRDGQTVEVDYDPARRELTFHVRVVEPAAVR